MKTFGTSGTSGVSCYAGYTEPMRYSQDTPEHIKTIIEFRNNRYSDKVQALEKACKWEDIHKVIDEYQEIDNAYFNY